MVLKSHWWWDLTTQDSRLTRNERHRIYARRSDAIPIQEKPCQVIPIRQFFVNGPFSRREWPNSGQHRRFGNDLF
jgi:hypothetical protein